MAVELGLGCFVDFRCWYRKDAVGEGRWRRRTDRLGDLACNQCCALAGCEMPEGPASFSRLCPQGLVQWDERGGVGTASNFRTTGRLACCKEPVPPPEWLRGDEV